MPGCCQRLTQEHLPQLLDLSASDPHAWPAKHWQSSLEKDWVWGWFLEDGSLAASLVLGWGYREAEVLYLLVRKDCRRQQLARRLLQKAEREARNQDAERLLLEVRAGNQAARAAYKAAGFQEDGLRKNYYASPTSPTGTEDAVLMSLSWASEL